MRTTQEQRILYSVAPIFSKCPARASSASPELVVTSHPTPG
ncbi:hypothetical protein [Desmonostoc muscorum]